MRFTTTGIGDPPLIFVHGFACDGTDWQAQCESLDKRTTVSRVGTARAQVPSPGTPAECSIEAYGAAVAKIPRGNCRRGRQYSWATAWDAVWCSRPIECSPTPCPAWYSSTAAESAAVIPSRPSKLWPMNSQETVTSIWVRDFFESMFFPSSNPALAKAIIERALRFPRGWAGP